MIWILLRRSEQTFLCMQDNLTTKPTRLKSLIICPDLKSYSKGLTSPILSQWLIATQASGVSTSTVTVSCYTRTLARGLFLPSFTYMYIAACTGGQFGDSCSTSKDCCLNKNYHCQLQNSAHFHADNECYPWTSKGYPCPFDI